LLRSSSESFTFSEVFAHEESFDRWQGGSIRSPARKKLPIRNWQPLAFREAALVSPVVRFQSIFSDGASTLQTGLKMKE